MQVIMPPVPFDFAMIGSRPSVFLAGTIDNGNSVDWQTKFVQLLPPSLQDDLTVLNPRRDDWDSSWAQEITNPQFREQVEWELRGLDSVSMPIFNFLGGSQSPITLMELGIVAAQYKENGQTPIVCCPKDFWRKGNVDIVCAKYDIPVVETMDDLMAKVIYNLTMLKVLSTRKPL